MAARRQPRAAAPRDDREAVLRMREMMSRRPAPSVARMPISRRRCSTEYRDDPVEADAGEQQADEPRSRQHRCREPPRIQNLADELRQRADAVDLDDAAAPRHERLASQPERAPGDRRRFGPTSVVAASANGVWATGSSIIAASCIGPQYRPDVIDHAHHFSPVAGLRALHEREPLSDGIASGPE